MINDTERLLASLDTQRKHVLGILDGLDEDALHRPVLPSGWTCLGMARHLTLSVEQFWFRGVFAAEPIEIVMGDEEAEAVWRVGPEVTGPTVFAGYREEIALANAIIASCPLDTPPAAWPDDIWPTWKLPDLHAIMLHVITETACHAGHLDAARELIDSRTWM